MFVKQGNTEESSNLCSKIAESVQYNDSFVYYKYFTVNTSHGIECSTNIMGIKSGFPVPWTFIICPTLLWKTSRKAVGFNIQ
jgi:hypothetical protein